MPIFALLKQCNYGKIKQRAKLLGGRFGVDVWIEDAEDLLKVVAILRKFTEILKTRIMMAK